MSSVRTMTVGDLGVLYDGPHATPTRRSNGTKYFLNISSLDAGRLDLAQSDLVDDTDFARWTRRVQPEESDLLFSYETRLGEAALMPSGVEACLGRRMALLRPNRTVVNPRFLLYRWLSPQFQSEIRQRSIHGATVSRIPLKDLSTWPIGVLPLPNQRAIAEVLGALDDKIAANRRIIDGGMALLDAHYSRIAKHRMGVTFKDVADLGGGGTPSTKDEALWNGEFRWATPTDVTGLDGPWLLDTNRHISAAGLSKITSKLYPRRTVIMTSRASIGYCAVLSGPTAVNQGFIAVDAKDDLMRPWLLAQLRSRTKEFLAWANGATFLELPKGIFKSLPVDMPNGGELDGFEKFADPVLDRVEAAQVENDTLASTRDELLPLLMNGRITVTDAEHRVAQEV